MTEVQPMKMAAAEALYESSDGHAPFSLFTIGSLDGKDKLVSVEVPGVLSYLATGDVAKPVEGINDLEKQLQATYGKDPLTTAASYTPTIWLAYWNFRLMMGAGFLAMLFGLMVLWRTRKGGLPMEKYWKLIGIWTPLLPVFAMSFGWIFTEIGRQPYIIRGIMRTSAAVTSNTDIYAFAWIFPASYAVLLAFTIWILRRHYLIKAHTTRV